MILFGLEFGSNRWACRPYCEKLVAAGYDVFAVEFRSQGDSDKDPNYEPLQWVTNRDVADLRSAIKYLLARPDADMKGIGVFGISKGGSTGLLAAANEKAIRCLATDGAYGTHTTMVPYLKRWIQIYSDRKLLQRVLPTWFYGIIGMVGAKKVARNRGVTYPSVEKAVARLNRPLFMIHGAGDNYIRPRWRRRSSTAPRAEGTVDRPQGQTQPGAHRFGRRLSCPRGGLLRRQPRQRRTTSRHGNPHAGRVSGSRISSSGCHIRSGSLTLAMFKPNQDGQDGQPGSYRPGHLVTKSGHLAFPFWPS